MTNILQWNFAKAARPDARIASVVHTASMGTTLLVFDLDAVPAGPTLKS